MSNDRNSHKGQRKARAGGIENISAVVIVFEPAVEVARLRRMTTPRWTFITNHGLVLSYISHNPSHTARDIANDVGITERTIHKIITDLEEAGYIERERVGRRNIYSVDPTLPLRHHSKREILVEDLLDAISHMPSEDSEESQEATA